MATPSSVNPSHNQSHTSKPNIPLPNFASTKSAGSHISTEVELGEGAVSDAALRAFGCVRSAFGGYINDRTHVAQIWSGDVLKKESPALKFMGSEEGKHFSAIVLEAFRVAVVHSFNLLMMSETFETDTKEKKDELLHEFDTIFKELNKLNFKNP